MLKTKTISIKSGICILMMFLTSCSTSKFIDDGQTLYRGASVTLSGPEVKKKDRNLPEEIVAKLYPKPNKRFLGVFYTKIWLHENVEPKDHKEKSFKHWLKYKIGQAPVLTSQVDTVTMTHIIEKLMRDNGFFHTTVTTEFKEKKKQVKIEYTVKHDKQIKIQEFRLPATSSTIDSLIRKWNKFSVKQGRVYRLSNFKNDRIRLSEHIREHGYYEFDEKDIVFLIDTSHASGNLVVDLKIKPPAKDSIYRKFYIDDVHIYPTYGSEFAGDSLAFKRNYTYKNIGISQNFEYLGRKAIYQILLLEPNSPYSVRNHNITVRRLINLDLFRYVNIQYEKQGGDSLDVNIFLTPAPYQGVQFDVEASTSNRGFFGSSLAVKYSNKNLFRGAQNFSLKASVGTEFQVVNDKFRMNLLNVYLEALLEFPGIIPFTRNRKVNTPVLPKSFLKLGETYQQWLQYYTLNSLDFAAGYTFQTRENINHKLEPFTLEWVKLINKTDEFQSILDGNSQLKNSFKTSMIFGQAYSVNVSSKKKETQKSHIYYSGSLALAGNVGYLAGRIIKGKQADPYEVLGVPFAQFAKLDHDLRHYWQIKRNKMSLVSRVNIGVGFAYGNSSLLPYVKQSFMGGPNTIRAFEFRSVGPGRFSSAADDGEEANPIEQAGDIKLLMNLEYRFAMYRFIHGALFVDAGNVWLRKPDPAREGGEFLLDQFYRQIALGTGFGVRLDFDFFVLRVDLGIPIYKPFNEEGQRWIPQYPEQGFKDWRKANWAWNIAIGYPF